MSTVLYMIVLFIAFEIGYFLDKKNRAFIANLQSKREKKSRQRKHNGN